MSEGFSSSSVLERILNSSSGCSVEIRTAGDYTYDDLHNNELLAETYVQFMSDHFGFEMDRHNDSTASTGAFIYPSLFFLYLCRREADGAYGADFGNVTYTLPACHPGFKIPAPTGSSNHTVPSPSPSTLVSSLVFPASLTLPLLVFLLYTQIGFTQAARTREGREAALKAAAGIANVGFRVVHEQAFADQARKSFDHWRKGDH